MHTRYSEKKVVRCVTKRSIRKNNSIVVFHSSVMRMSFSSRKSYQSVTVVTVKAAAELLSTFQSYCQPKSANVSNVWA